MVRTGFRESFVLKYYGNMWSTLVTKKILSMDIEYMWSILSGSSSLSPLKQDLYLKSRYKFIEGGWKGHSKDDSTSVEDSSHPTLQTRLHEKGVRNSPI